MSSALVSTKHLLPDLLLLAEGKVRELYQLNDGALLFVASDRISAYDVVLKNAIPSKGVILTKITEFWISLINSKLPHVKTHLLSLEKPESVSDSSWREIENRCCRVRKLKMYPLEAIVRGCLTGSAYVEYQRSGTVHGMKFPPGLKESEAFPEPIYTPSTKATAGESDVNISQERAAELVGAEVAEKIKTLALSIYKMARQYAAERGIILADTKLEFGQDENGDVVLADEVLTPDSSRFWSAETYSVGESQDSYDKQFLRDWLTRKHLKGKEGVEVPSEIVEKTASKYREAYERLVGKPFNAAC